MAKAFNVLRDTVKAAVAGYNTAAFRLFNVLPDLLDHWLEHGDSTLCNAVLNGIDSASDKRRLRAILLAMVGEDSLLITYDKKTNIFSSKSRAASKGGRVLNDNARSIVLDLIEKHSGKLSFRSPIIDAALFNEQKTPPEFDMLKSALSLIKRAHKQGVTDTEILYAIRAACDEERKNAVVQSATADAKSAEARAAAKNGPESVAAGPKAVASAA